MNDPGLKRLPACLSRLSALGMKVGKCVSLRYLIPMSHLSSLVWLSELSLRLDSIVYLLCATDSFSGPPYRKCVGIPHDAV
jgi:hypothetical protein